MNAAPADDFTQLVAHVFAHLPLVGPGNLYDPSYVRWARSALPPEAVEPVVTDAQVIAARYAAVPHALTIHGFPELHGSIKQFLETAARPIEQLRPSDVSHEGALRALLGMDRVLVELIRAAMALAGRAYGEVMPDRIIPELDAAVHRVEGPLTTAMALMPELAAVRVELVHGLGVHGRGFTNRILVGAPVSWSAHDAAHAAVLAMHERAVQLEAVEAPDPYEAYVRSEYAALSRLAHLMRGAPRELSEAHARWLSSVDLTDLIEHAGQLGLDVPVES